MCISAVLASTVAPSRISGTISISGESLRKQATASGRPAMVPALRAASTVRLGVPTGTVAMEVTSPARPRSSASARVTASSISSGETNPSG